VTTPRLRPERNGVLDHSNDKREKEHIEVSSPTLKVRSKAITAREDVALVMGTSRLIIDEHSVAAFHAEALGGMRDLSLDTEHDLSASGVTDGLVNEVPSGLTRGDLVAHDVLLGIVGGVGAVRGRGMSAPDGAEGKVVPRGGVGAVGACVGGGAGSRGDHTRPGGLVAKRIYQGSFSVGVGDGLHEASITEDHGGSMALGLDTSGDHLVSSVLLGKGGFRLSALFFIFFVLIIIV
jgi:hypothetical protein